MKILITGVAGFIGFNFAKHLLQKKYEVFGIDNFDNYYSVKFKFLRIKELKKSKNFFFKKIDITNVVQLKNFFKNKKFDFIFHFAAQAGVRYSLINPKKYLKVNKHGFENIVSNIKKNKNLKTFFYASSSSVYGSRKKFPSSEKIKLLPQSIYARTKVGNEILAKKISKKTSFNLIGLRFFTVYGEWGRPDMFIFKLLNSHKNNKKFYLNNYGNHERDFTYIKDIVLILEKFMKIKKFDHRIFNICSSRPINIRTLCYYLKSKLKIKNIIEVKKNSFDVNKTHGDNSLLKKYFKIKKFTSFQTGLNNTVKWYLKNKIYKL
tara:strand:+ start:37 stop:996 length:960 start_codon:yes stop_codon:yes gene_type:complete